MKNWKAVLLIIACFVIVALVDSPDNYDFRSADPVMFEYETAVMEQHAALVEKPVEKSAVLVNYPSPTLWR
jgi:hypothetical protein